MKRLLIALLLSFGLAISANAQKYVNDNVHHHMTQKEIQKMDRVYTKHQAKRINFKNEREYSRHSKHNSYAKAYRYSEGYHYKRDRYKDNYQNKRQQGYRYSKRGWKLAYKYDRASFYDSRGYHYGYFNRHGFLFEGYFYRYDRYYTYKDRVRGKGIFDHRYYMPANSRYYGFSITQQ